MRKINFLSARALLFLICLLLLAVSATTASAAQQLLVFNPGAMGGNMATLIDAANDYFGSRNLDLKFQPIAKFKQFKQRVGSARYVIMPDWSYKLLEDQHDFSPLLSPQVNGSPNFTKILIAKKGAISSPVDLKGKKVATISQGQRTNNILDRVLFEGTGVQADQLNFIFVGKDLDGLMAVKFGQVQATIASSTNFSLIKKKKPFVIKGLKIVKKSGPLIRASLFSVGGDGNDRVVKAFENMEKSEKGKKLLSLLNLGGWIDYPQ